MEKFIRVREELYGYLYDRFLADDGPYCGRRELEGLCKTNRLMRSAMSFAKDLEHIKFNRFGGVKLTGAGILYFEKEYPEANHGD